MVRFGVISLFHQFNKDSISLNSISRILFFNFLLNRYEVLEPQEQDANLRSDGTPPPLPARQNYQAIGGVKNSQSQQNNKKDKDIIHSHYSTSKQFSESNNGNKHHLHDQNSSKESNYSSQRHSESYQRIDTATQRSHELTSAVSSNYVKLQKEKYEIGKQFEQNNSIYASQRDLHTKNETNHHTHHQKLTVSNSLPLTQNSTYSLPKSGSNNNLVRFTEFEQQKNERGVAKLEQSNERRGYCNYEFEDQGNSVSTSCGDKNNIKTATTEHGDPIRYEIPHEFKLGDKVTCLKTSISERPVPLKPASIEYRHKDLSSSLPPEQRIPDGNSTDISTLPSEDELSNGSGSVSPRLRRANRHRTGNLTPSNAGSRNQSPRPKPGARNSHRNSANLSSSTLQEDLMKLINPDYIADDLHVANNNLANNNSNNNNKSSNNNLLEIQNRCRSRENLCGNSASTLSVLPGNQQENCNVSEVILTMARPATVISNASTASSPAPSENKLSKEERCALKSGVRPAGSPTRGSRVVKELKASFRSFRLSPRVTKPSPHAATAASAKTSNNNNSGNSSRESKTQIVEPEIDWPSLMDSTTRAIKQLGQEWQEDRGAGTESVTNSS